MTHKPTFLFDGCQPDATGAPVPKNLPRARSAVQPVASAPTTPPPPKPTYDRRKRREAWPDIADQSDDWLDNPRDVRAVLCLGMCLISGALLALGALVFAVGKLAGVW
jgi:hypothetical protein